MAGSVWLRPERAAVGRPARRSRAEITDAAVEVADREGLDAVSMRRVATELGTGAGTLYRYVETRDELIDLMADHVVGEYDLTRSGQWLPDLVDLGMQARGIHRRHRWLAERVLTAPGTGPNTVDVVEHVLAVLEDHPADDGAKLVAFGVLQALVATMSRAEHVQRGLERNAEYMAHVAAAGTHPHLAALRTSEPGPDDDPLPRILEGVLLGLLPDEGGRERG